MESDILQPPIRIQTTTFSPVSIHQAQVNLDAFLANFQQRTAISSGDSTLNVQLQKLSAALAASRQKSKKSKRSEV